MTEQVEHLFAELPQYLGGHMLLSASALLVGLVISVPLGIMVSRHRRRGEVVLGLAGIIQTVPSLALLALMVPLLGGMIGFVPAFIALTLYSILPALSNTITGIRGVDPALLEAARGLGMNERQVLFRVQLPLAAPVIIAGIRTATVLVVGTATLVTPVGGTGLGNYIFQGLETRNHLATVFGCVFAALLAIVMDQLIRILEIAAQRRSRRLAWLGLAGLLLVLGGGLYAPTARLLAAEDGSHVFVGSGPFTEQHILSEVLAQKLRPAGYTVDQRKGMGETIQFEALRRSQIDCLVDYSGNIWSVVMKRTATTDRQTTLDEVTRYLAEEHGIVCLGSLGFENAYALAMPEDQARQLGIRSIGDLQGHAARWHVAGDNQIFSRPEWQKLKSSYGLKFDREISMDPTLMYDAAGKGAQVICAYTSDGRIPATNLLLLQDPKQVFPPYDAILLLSPRAAARPDLVQSLRSLVGAIDLSSMQRANRSVDVDGLSPGKAAQAMMESVPRK